MYSKSQAIALGTQKLYDLIESFTECVGLIEVISDVAEGSATEDRMRVWHACKTLALKIYGDEAREVIREVWGGCLAEFFEDFWRKPNRDIQERVAAARWANSLEGISDLRRIWGVHPKDVTTDELSAFSHTLPLDSASQLASGGWQVPVDIVVAAQQADLAKLRLKQAAGKSGRLPESESMVAMVKKKTGGASDEVKRLLVEKQRAYLAEQKKKQARGGS